MQLLVVLLEVADLPLEEIHVDVPDLEGRGLLADIVVAEHAEQIRLDLKKKIILNGREKFPRKVKQGRLREQENFSRFNRSIFSFFLRSERVAFYPSNLCLARNRGFVSFMFLFWQVTSLGLNPRSLT